jgi:carboxymethylenebutenolidase
MSEQLQVSVPDGSFACYVARPAGPEPHAVIVVLQEIFGVNAGIRSIADDYAAKGYIAVCPDLFWRSAPGLSLSEDKEGDWDTGFRLYNDYDVEQGVDDIAATIAAARTLPGAKRKVGVTGYCLGGLMTFLSAARSDADAFVAYYGGGTERYVDRAQQITAPLLYHLAGADEYIGPEAQAAIRAVLIRPNTEVRVYPGCNHAFARPGGNHYNAEAATLANSRSDAFWRHYLA